MKKKVLDIINEIRAAKDLTAVEKLNSEDNLRDNLGLNSFDLAELIARPLYPVCALILEICTIAPRVW